MRFERLSLDDGLSQSNVLAIQQDRAGRMWFGTENGLNSFDGYRFEHFRRERGNPDALADDFIYDIAESPDGTLWIATNGGGLAMMEAGQGRFRTFRHDPADPSSIAGNVVRQVLVDSSGGLWIGTRGGGVDNFDPATGKATNYRFDDEAEANANEIHVLYEDTTGGLWIGSNRGLARLDLETGSLERYLQNGPDAATLTDRRVRAVLEDRQGRIWVGTYDGGLSLLDRTTGTFRHFRHDHEDPASLPNDRVTSVFEDDQGRIWVGTFGGLSLLLDAERGEFARYPHDPADPTSLGDDAVTAIYQDRGGVLWVGTQTGGLSKWNPRTWGYGLEQGRELSATDEAALDVMSFVEDAEGTLWIGSFGDGLVALDRETGETRSFHHDPEDAGSLSDDVVMSLMADRRGRIWAGTMTGGINLVDPETGLIEHLQHDPDDERSLSANGVMAMLEDSRGYVWVGTFGGGISRFDPESNVFERFPADTTGRGPSSNRVTSFAEDPMSGAIWIGTDAGGLNLFDPASGRFHYLRHDPADARTLSADTVFAIEIDATGTVWVGTRGGGLDRVVGDVRDPARIRFENVSEADGLANGVVNGLQSDNAGRLWLSTNYGLSRFDPRDGSIRNLHRADGLQSEEFNFGAHYASADGELFFGGTRGFNAFRPEDLQANENIPAIALTAFVGGGDRLRADGSGDAALNLGYRDAEISFEFAALDYAAPERNQYMYKLEGFNDDWVDLGTRRHITFTNLDDGNYLLRVRASNSDGVWNEAGLALPLRVTPAPWATWWAYAGYLLMAAQVALALWLGHKRKLRREEEYSHRLEEEVRQRTEKLIESNEKLRQANQALQESSLSDPLTGLKNRRFVLEEVSRDLDVIRRRLEDEAHGIDTRRNVDLTFMMIDLDHFKPINDTYGHAAGDRMLLEVRDVLLSACRKSDFVIRWGGDEFVVIAKQARPGESEALAERIRTRIAEHQFKLGDGQIARTTCSIGFAAYPLFRSTADGTSLDRIINLADDLMYESKKKRNAWAGMLSATQAATSSNFDLDSIDSTSVLFRALRAGGLTAGADAAGADHGGHMRAVG